MVQMFSNYFLTCKGIIFDNVLNSAGKKYKAPDNILLLWDKIHKNKGEIFLG
jgi:hypothetical protein